MAWRGLEPTQLTYYDFEYVQGALQNFLNDRMVMTNTDAFFDKNKNLTLAYQDKMSNGKLNFTFNNFTAKINDEDVEITKSILVKGTPNRLFNFFVNYYKSTMHFNDFKSDVMVHQMQDDVRLFFNSGKPYITITNSTYKSKDEFLNFLKTKQQ